MPPAVPAPVVTGTDSYYRDRRADFVRRHPTGEPPSYYARYGDKCLQQFLRVEPDFTPDGQAWLQRTLVALQELMEAARADDPAAFGALEQDGDEFTRFAFSTHARAYLDAGLLRLPVDDLWRIVRTPDLVDLLTRDGVKEIAAVLDAMSLGDVAAILSASLGPRPGRPNAAQGQPPSRAVS